jgi:ABC-type Fe3+-hydroxamate transport system substrate-binding protein/adenosylcobinamide amidohydrolase
MSTERARGALGLSLALCWLLSACGAAGAYPVRFADSADRQIVIERPPRRVVSLVPSVTDAILAIGAGEALVGVTYHDSAPQASRKTIVGGFARPSLDAIEQLDPDLIFATSYQASKLQRMVDQGRTVVVFDDTSLGDMYRRIEILGKVLGRKQRATEVVREIRRSLDRVATKVSRVPEAERRRVIRVMGRATAMAPGDDSFQNELIRAAGGVPPELGRRGAVVEVSAEQWRRFDPQVIYHCEGDEAIVERLRDDQSWNQVEAFRESRIYRFPCDLTCRTTPHAAEFAAWLASSIYPEEFGADASPVSPDRVLEQREIELPLSYVSSAAVVTTSILDFENHTLVIDLEEPMRVLSTLDGAREGVRTVANHHAPPPCWGALHELGPAGYGERVLRTLERSADSASLLFTGADLENLAVRSESCKELEVHALVTAGVSGNALRVSEDQGSFYEPGTINAIVMANARLTERAMARAVISATEAKTAALQDLDIRSSQDPSHQATGTGTDNVIIVEGRGAHTVDGAGGHCKMGELISKAVYRAVIEAIGKQNGIYPGRPVLRRLRERELTPTAVARTLLGGLVDDTFAAAAELEHLLLDRRYASFIETSLALSDAHRRGQVSDLSAHRTLCRAMFEELADGGEAPKDSPLAEAEEMPLVLRMSFGALLEGLAASGRIRLETGEAAGDTDAP